MAARAAHITLPAVRGPLRDEGEEPRRLPPAALAIWTSRNDAAWEPPLFKAPVGVALRPKRKDQIQLIELPPTDEKR